MTTKQRNWAIGLGGTCLILVLLLAALRFFLPGGRAYTLNLPDYGDLRGVTLTPEDGEAVELADAYGEDVLFVLKGNGRTTRNESIQDAPVNVDNWIQVDFAHKGGGTSTLFVYQKSDARDGEFFIEQPYNGIYEISGDEYQTIEKYAG